MEDRAVSRPRPVLDADARLVGHVAEIGVDADGKVEQLVLDLTPEASEALFGKGMRHGVLAVEPADVKTTDDAVRLVRNLGDLRIGWKRADADEDA